jgi:hypothetical protein
MTRRVSSVLATMALVCVAGSACAQDVHKQLLKDYRLPAAPVVEPVPASTVVHLAIGVQLKDAAGLRSFVEAVANPKNPQFRHFLTLDQLTEKYGPSAADYQTVIAWAQANKLTVESQFPHRLLLTVQGTAADFERALAVKLGYAKRADGTTFYRPDRAPSVDLAVKLSHLSGIDNFFVPKPRNGSQLNGQAYASSDLRNAYATTCQGLTGAGQSVGIMAYSGYQHPDVTQYESTVGITTTSNPTCGQSTVGSPPCLNDIGVNGFNTSTIVTNYANEATADVELAMALAPGLQQVVVFEGDASTGCTAGDAMIASMLMQTAVKQFSSSVGFCLSDDTSPFDMMAAAGQSFFLSSGDYGTGYYSNGSPMFTTVLQNAVTPVGGTVLTMNGSGQSYNGEQAWMYSGGGVESYTTPASSCTPGCTPGSTCPNTCIPPWQAGVANAQNGASATFHNDPDIAMPSVELFIVNQGNPTYFCGTSASSPLMAGFMALINQQMCLNAGAPANCTLGGGFISPALYAIGLNAATYATSYRSVVGTSTNNACGGGGQSAPAVAGYNLATGWGSPSCGLVDQLTCTTCNGTAATPGTLPSTSCVSFQSDPNNCGSCGNVCQAGNSCVRGACRSGSSNGDTHLTTFDGLYYDFQATGDFVLATRSDDFEIQARQASGAPLWPDAAVNKSIAVRMGKDRIALCVEPDRLFVNGKTRNLRSGKSLALAGGLKVARDGKTYSITRRDGENVQIELNPSWINVGVGLGHAPHSDVGGLLGNADGATSNDIAVRNGAVLKQPVVFQDLYGKYGNSLRLAAKDSMLCGKKFRDSNPQRPFFAGDLANKDFAAAETTCRTEGVKDKALLDACILDTTVLADRKAAGVFARSLPPIVVMHLGTVK